MTQREIEEEKKKYCRCATYMTCYYCSTYKLMKERLLIEILKTKGVNYDTKRN